jgi:uncharacterized protein involved in exopolysaccharide biosynthesis
MAADETEARESIPEFLRDPRGILRRRWPFMAAVLVVGLAATAVMGFAFVPKFAAHATLMVASQNITEDFVRPTVEDDSMERINAMMGEALAQQNLAELIEKHDLYPKLRAKFPLVEVVTAMREDLEVKPAEAMGGSFSNEAARLYEISFRSERPDVAAAVTNAVADLFTAASSRMRARQADLATQFLRRELEEARESLRDQNRSIREFKEAHRGELPEELEANLRKLERLQLQRQSLALQIAEAEGRIVTYIAGSENAPESRLEKLRGQLASELAIHTEEHPNVTSLKRQITAVEAEVSGRGNVSGGSSHLVGATERELAVLRSELANVEREQHELDQRVGFTPARQEELAGMEERAAVLRDNYQEFLRKVQDAELARDLEVAQQGARAVVIDRASPPAEPERPLWKFIALGLFASIALAGATGVLLEFIDPVALSVGQIESLTGQPVLGSVARIG